ncbi:beta-lactamase-like protein 2 [Dendronephthya gigantea]|uniref:beta-lactamase-like protein 2 n=1 Tax=Dendronephthya gigantea TaxID=151771 RepID=UPI00106912DB|nr:beta-lactamase-like protein 2 [Dendronephthya gigantea]
MPSTVVRYVTRDDDSKESIAKDIPKDIKLFYLKATIAILTLALATVSAILVWKLLVDHETDCIKDVTQIPNEEEKDESLNSQRQDCPPVGNLNSLPYILPRAFQQTFDEIKQRLKKEVEKQTLVSVSSTAVFRNRVLWNAAYGVLDKSVVPRRSPDKETLYRTGSLVKLLTVLLTFKLLQDKRLDCLDDPLKKYLPEFSVKSVNIKDSVTIRQILSHTSGLQREVPCGPSFSSNHQNICPVNTTYVIEKLKSFKLKFTPGTSVGYSNLGYAILAHALFEKFGGKYESWQEWMFSEVLYPLRMKRTVLKNDRFFDNVAKNYKSNGVLSPQLNWGWSSPSFQMLTSTNDQAKLMLGILNPGTSFIDEMMIRDMFKPEFVFPDLQIFSPGWQIRYHHSIRTITNAGAVPGSSSAMILLPEQKFGLVILATGQEIVPKLAQEISKKLSKTFSMNVVLNSLEIKPPPKSRRYIGLYMLKNSWSDKVKAIISIESFTGRLMLKQDPGYPPFVYLSFKDHQHLQIVYPRGLTCLAYSLGQDKENIVFKHLDYEDRYSQFTLGSFVFERIKK